MSASSVSSGNHILDLPHELLLKALSFLQSPTELGKCALVCRSFSALSDNPDLWQAIANAKYGNALVKETLVEYDSYRAMVRDDNRLGALPIKYINRPCFYQYNRTEYFFCCLIVSIQWDRCSGHVRLNIDARGERDLRPPHRSSVYCKNKLHVAVPLSVLEETAVPGHFKGCLVFEDDTFPGLFCYANHMRAGFLDYSPVPTLEDQLQVTTWDGYTSRYNPSVFSNDTDEIERLRWKDVVPEAVLNRTMGQFGNGRWWV